MGKSIKAFIGRASGFTAFDGKLSRKEAGALLLTLAAALALWLFISANYRRDAAAEISKSLITINAYKTAQISAWHDDHLREAVRLSRHPFLGEIVSEELARPGSRKAQLTAWAGDHARQKRYAAMTFLSPKGAVIAATAGFTGGAEKEYKEALARAAAGTALLTDLYLAADGCPRMTMFSPISPGGHGGRTLCVLVIDIDPAAEFYPLLKAAPLFFAKAETQLVRKEGHNALFLNEMEYSRDSALKLTRPLSEEHLSAAAALSGHSGFFTGVDYRGVKVFSAMGPVAGTGWALITKIDREIILAPVRTRQQLALALALLLPAAALVYAVFLLILRKRLRAAQALAEEALRESEQRLRITLEETQIGTWDWDVVHDTWRASATYFTMLGYAPEPGLSDRNVWLSRVHPDDAGQVAGKIRGVLAGADAKYQYEARLRHADGTYHWIAVLGKTVERDGYGRPARIIGVRMDITERKAAELALRESEAYIRTVLDNLPIGIAVNSVDPDVTFSYMNGLFPGIYRTTKEALAKPDAFWEAVYQEPEQREELKKRVLADCASGDPARMRWAEVPLTRPGERTTFITAQNIPLPGGKLMISTVLDVTERKLAEEKLEQAARNWRDTFNAIDDMVWMLDAENRIIRVNKATEKTFTLPVAEMIGRHCWELVHRTSGPIPECPVVPAKKHLRRETAEYYIKNKTFEIIVDPIIGADGQYGGAVHILRDITVRKLAELEREKLNRDLVEKKKEMENFLYITTHDLRSPLVNIQGFSHNLARYVQELRQLLLRLPLPPDAGAALEKLTADSMPEALKFVTESARKMDSLITSLLKVSRVGRVEMKPETVEMNGLLKKILASLFYHLEDAGGKINYGSLPPCKADPSAVSQIFTNLLDNAVKYRHKDRPLAVDVTGEIIGGMTVYRVADNGSGIPAADLEKVWSVFYQVRSFGVPGKKGEGIGLHMVKLMAEKNGGGISVESKEGEGSVFYVELPAAGGEAL